MILKLGKRTKTCKTEISGKSLISPFFQRQFRSRFPYKLKTKIDVGGGLVGGVYEPQNVVKNLSFFECTVFGLQIGLEMNTNRAYRLGTVRNPPFSHIRFPRLLD